MRLVFGYIISYRNIEHQAFDFGSEYTYTAHVKDDGYLYVNREKNLKYIPGLYKNDTAEGFENITAVVGENGSGKTTLSNFLIEALTDKESLSGLEYAALRNFQEGLSSDENYRKLRQKRKLDRDNHPLTYALIFIDKNNIHVRSNNSKKIILTTIIDGIQENNQFIDYVATSEEFNVIYYNPIYDFREVVAKRYTYFADVSSDKLLKYDIHGQENIEGYGDKSIDVHKLLNIYRQLNFINNFKNQNISLSFIPDRIIVRIHPNGLPDEFDSSKLRNVRGLESFYDRIRDLWVQITDPLFELRHKLSKEHERQSEEYKNINNQIAKTYAYYYMAAIMFIQIDKNNNLISGYFDDNKVNYQTNSFHTLIESFIIQQGKFGYEAVHLMEAIDKSIETAIDVNEVSGLDVLKITISTEQAQELLPTYNKFLAKLPNIMADQPPAYFMHFEWGHNVSSGERAFLDVFSRLYAARLEIIKRFEERELWNENKKFPQTTYIIIDEGELGFHLQWQKEYISNLIQYIPKILSFKEYAEENSRNELNLVLTTHSPICLSDIAQYNIIYMARQDGKCVVAEDNTRPSRSFGANIHDILHDAFFLHDGFIGKFAHNKIDEVIKLLVEDKPLDNLKQTYVTRLINLVDEPIIKVKLKELYAQKVGLNVELERINAQIEQLQKQREQIQKRSQDDNNQ